MIHLPSDNPFTIPVYLLLILSIIKATAMTLVIVALVWFGKRLKKAEERQDKVLALAENYAKLGAQRREDAKEIIGRKLEEKAEEIKGEVAKVPIETAKIVSSDAVSREGSTSGIFKKGNQ